jgi:hypothetical protein
MFPQLDISLLQLPSTPIVFQFGMKHVWDEADIKSKAQLQDHKLFQVFKFLYSLTPLINGTQGQYITMEKYKYNNIKSCGGK